MLVSRPGGYALMVAPDQLDYLVFEQLSEEGRDALLRGDAETASTLLRRALSLWRGEAFCDLTLEEVAQREVLRLDGLRLATLMDRLDADLALGADAELVPELEALIARHPSQERLLGQLMLALYRSGRQADALAAYRRHSQVMRNELGLEVGPGVVNLERQILCHDPDLAAPPRSPNGAGGRVIVCPYKGLASFEAADAEYFCGREQIVANLIARVAEGRLVGIVGASGMGKSSLLRAGLMPALAAGALPGSETWEYVLVRPGGDPSRASPRVVRSLHEIVRFAARAFEHLTGHQDAALKSGNRGQLVDHLPERLGVRVVHVVDDRKSGFEAEEWRPDGRPVAGRLRASPSLPTRFPMRWRRRRRQESLNVVCARQRQGHRVGFALRMHHEARSFQAQRLNLSCDRVRCRTDPEGEPRAAMPGRLRRDTRIVAVVNEHSAVRKRVNQLTLRGGDVVDRIEELQMHGFHVRQDAEFRRRSLGELGDLTLGAHTQLKDGDVVSAVEPQQGLRETVQVIEIPRRSMHAETDFQQVRQHLLGGRLSGAARNRSHAPAPGFSVGRSQPQQGFGGVRDFDENLPEQHRPALAKSQLQRLRPKTPRET